MAGGDSAARGLAAGMILGAALGEAAVPEAWVRSMVRGNDIMALLAALDRAGT